jgi:hypothetical protein
MEGDARIEASGPGIRVAIERDHPGPGQRLEHRSRVPPAAVRRIEDHSPVEGEQPMHHPIDHDRNVIGTVHGQPSRALASIWKRAE